MKTEQGVLRLSIAVVFLLALVGIAFGILSGSSSIMFDGVYSLMDAVMTALALLVTKLVTSSLAEARQKKLVQHFTMGFWHLEPIVLGLSGAMLVGASLYALFNAIGSLLSGGRELSFDKATTYAAISMAVSLAMAVWCARANRAIGSAFLALDARNWLVSAIMDGALLIAFIFGVSIEGTSRAWLAPYIDPLTLAVVCLVAIPLPIPSLRRALADILLVTPPEMKRHVDEVAEAVTQRYGFLTWRAYVARVGRGRQIELHFIAPTGQPPRPLEEWDRIRDEIGEAIGGDTPDRWLTISFTTDIEWAE